MNTVIHVKINDELKKQAQVLAKKMGLPLSTVISASLRDFVRTESITFSADPSLKPEIEDELVRLSKQKLDERKDLSESFSNAKDATKWLKNTK